MTTRNPVRSSDYVPCSLSFQSRRTSSSFLYSSCASHCQVHAFNHQPWMEKKAASFISVDLSSDHSYIITPFFNENNSIDRADSPFFFSSPWQPHTFAFRIFSIHLPSLIFAVRELRSSFVSSRLINQDKIFIAKFQSWLLCFYWLIESWRGKADGLLCFRFQIFCKCISFCFIVVKVINN